MKNEAEIIGSRYAIGMVGMVVVLIQFLLAGLSFLSCRACQNAPFLLLNLFKGLPITSTIGLITVLSSSYLLGKRAGRRTIVEAKAYWWEGPQAAVAVFLLVTVVVVSVGLKEIEWQTQELPKVHNNDYFKTLGITLSTGISPIILIGIGYGRILKGKRNNQT